MKVMVANITVFCVPGTTTSELSCFPRRVKLREVKWFAKVSIVNNWEIHYLSPVSLTPALLYVTYRWKVKAQPRVQSPADSSPLHSRLWVP